MIIKPSNIVVENDTVVFTAFQYEQLKKQIDQYNEIEKIIAEYKKSYSIMKKQIQELIEERDLLEEKNIQFKRELRKYKKGSAKNG